jgi:hypothetical protein
VIFVERGKGLRRKVIACDKVCLARWAVSLLSCEAVNFLWLMRFPGRAFMTTVFL